MKKFRNIAIAVLVVLLVVGALLIDSFPIPSSSAYDRMPLELKGEMLSNWPADRFGGKRWGSEAIVYYGTHKDCVAFLYRKFSWPSVSHRFEVAGYEFAYAHYFEIIVYRDGEYIDLSEAYQRGWLSQQQIKSIAHYHQTNPTINGVIGY